MDFMRGINIEIGKGRSFNVVVGKEDGTEV